MYDLLVTGGTVVTATMTALLDVAVIDERITALGVPAPSAPTRGGSSTPAAASFSPAASTLTATTESTSRASDDRGSGVLSCGGLRRHDDDHRFRDQLPPKALHDAIERRRRVGRAMAVD